jgi:hypothetical protein
MRIIDILAPAQIWLFIRMVSDQRLTQVSMISWYMPENFVSLAC